MGGNDEGWAAAGGPGGCHNTPTSYLMPPSLSISRILHVSPDPASRLEPVPTPVLEQSRVAHRTQELSLQDAGVTILDVKLCQRVATRSATPPSGC